MSNIDISNNAQINNIIKITDLKTYIPLNRYPCKKRLDGFMGKITYYRQI